LSRIPVGTEATALPQAYRLTLGIGPTKTSAPPATAVVQGARQQRVPVATVVLTPGSTAVSALPRDMRALDGPPLVGGGLELIGARPLPEEAAVGSQLKVGLLWRAVDNQPHAREFTMRLVRSNGEVVQETVLPLLGGRLSPSALHAGTVVRDEQALTVGARVPTEPLAVELNLQEAKLTLGRVKMTGRPHVFDPALSNNPKATFGGLIALQDVRL
jgi:hypothetical protein